MSLNLDQLVAELPELQPPLELRDRVLAEVKAEMQIADVVVLARPSPRVWLYPGLAVAAAALLVVSIRMPGAPVLQSPESTTSVKDVSVAPSDQAVGDPADLVPKGAGAVVPKVELKMNVRSEGTVARFVEGEAYGPGTELYFRAWLDSSAELTLVRMDADSVERVHLQSASPGEQDLSLPDGATLAWRIEGGEASAVFALLAEPGSEGGLSRGSLDWDLVVSRLEGTYDLEHAESFCGALQGLDLGCYSQAVRVSP